MTRSLDVKKLLQEKYDQQQNAIEAAKTNIIVLDDAREPLRGAIYNVDRVIYSELEEINQTLYDVTEAYQERINVGCRTDMFWLQTGYSSGGSGTLYTYTCTSISYGNYADTARLPVGLGSIAVPENYGYETDNLHGVKQYTEPYYEDLLDTYIGSGIGTIGVGTTELYILAPISSNGITGLEVGQIVQSSKDLVFSGNVNTIVGISTVNVDLSTIPELGITETSSTINVLALESQAIQNAFAPEDDGKFVTFTVLMDPNNLPNDFAVSPGTSPFVPQTVNKMGSSSLGSAANISYDNSGSPEASQQWNQYMNGLQDPSRNFQTVTPPNVGAGLTYYRVGFTTAPAIFSGGSFSRLAVEGESVTTEYKIGTLSSPAGWTNVPSSSCPSQETAITDAEAVRDATELEFNTTGITTLNNKVSLANALRTDLNELNLRIWAYRTQIGQAQENQFEYSTLINLIDQPENKELIDRG